jgi:hypothetical protein
MFSPIPPRDENTPPPPSDMPRRRDYGDDVPDIRLHNDDSELTGAELAIAILCSGIGCIMGFVFLVQGKPKAGKMILISLACSLGWGVVRFLITQSMRPGF